MNRILRGHNVQYYIKKSRFYGNNNVLSGNNNVIRGNNNIIKGSHNRVYGNNNFLFGNNNYCQGRNNYSNKLIDPLEIDFTSPLRLISNSQEMFEDYLPILRQINTTITTTTTTTVTTQEPLDFLVSFLNQTKKKLTLPEKKDQPAKHKNEQCPICYQNKKSILYAPCHHLASCNSCAQQIIKMNKVVCPLCRTPVEKVLTIFP